MIMPIRKRMADLNMDMATSSVLLLLVPIPPLFIVSAVAEFFFYFLCVCWLVSCVSGGLLGFCLVF